MEGILVNSGFWNIQINGRMNFYEAQFLIEISVMNDEAAVLEKHHKYIYINNKCLFIRLHPHFDSSRIEKKKEHRRGRFFPLSFNFTHRGAASMLKCYTTIDSLISLSPSFLPLRWRTKKKEEREWIERDTLN